MEKVILIDGKEVKFKSTGATPLRYKAQFGQDFFKSIAKLQGLAELNDPNALENIDFEAFYNIAWVMAKTADNNIGDPITWLDSFDNFPIVEVIGGLTDLILSTLESKKK